jgi:hypothetical protein
MTEGQHQAFAFFVGGKLSILEEQETDQPQKRNMPVCLSEMLWMKGLQSEL